MAPAPKRLNHATPVRRTTRPRSKAPKVQPARPCPHPAHGPAPLVPPRPLPYLTRMSTEPDQAAPPAHSDPADPTPADAPHQDADPSAQIAQLTAERDDMRDRWMRAEAEMQNVRARAKRDVDDTRQYAVQKFAADVVEAAENLRRGLNTLPAHEDAEPDIVTKLRSGLDGVERSFVAILERNGIKRTDPTGQPFDANLHQAMAEQPSGDHPPGTVIQAWTQAWTLNGRLLRPAMVVVAKAAPADAPAAAPADPALDTHSQEDSAA